MAWGDEAALGSGLPDRFQFTVTSARIKYPYEKNPTQPALVLDGEQNVDGEIEDQHIWLKAGEQFEPGDKEGTFWLHTKQTPDVFDTPGAKINKLNKNSGYGRFLNSLLTVAGTAPLEENQQSDRAKYQIWDVLFWEGMILDIKVEDEEYEFTVKDGPDKGKLIKGSKRQEYILGVVGKADVSGATSTTPEDQSGAATSNGTLGDLASYDSHMAYMDAYVKANGGVAGASSQEDWKAAREGANA